MEMKRGDLKSIEWNVILFFGVCMCIKKRRTWLNMHSFPMNCTAEKSRREAVLDFHYRVLLSSSDRKRLFCRTENPRDPPTKVITVTIKIWLEIHIWYEWMPKLNMQFKITSLLKCHSNWFLLFLMFFGCAFIRTPLGGFALRCKWYAMQRFRSFHHAFYI